MNIFWLPEQAITKRMSTELEVSLTPQADVILQLNRISFELTVEKLNRSNGLTWNDSGIGMSGNAKGCFEINDLTKEPCQLIKKTQVALDNLF